MGLGNVRSNSSRHQARRCDGSEGLLVPEGDLELLGVGLGDHDVINTLNGTATKKVSNKKILESIERRGGASNLIPCTDICVENGESSVFWGLMEIFTWLLVVQ